uniref:Uncharacterized protein n=1 Tax=Arundo donax TaxID=35708 RepID=A0A0A9D999_ARUDO
MKCYRCREEQQPIKAACTILVLESKHQRLHTYIRIYAFRLLSVLLSLILEHDQVMASVLIYPLLSDVHHGAKIC